MKKLILIALLALALQAHATSWRVCSDTYAHADFTCLSTAIENYQVHAGDTLFIEPGHSQSTDRYSISKRVVIIGRGNSLLQGQWTITASGVKIIGCKFDCMFTCGTNTTLERCTFTSLLVLKSGCVVRNCQLFSLQGNSSSVENVLIENNVVIKTSSSY